jgi:hypothetical protein
MALPLKQVAALPIVETARGPLVLLITTRERGRWTIPRGWPKPGLTDADLAGPLEWLISASRESPS